MRAQQAALDQAQAAYQAAVLTALKDVEDALVALRGDRERLVRLQHAAEAAGNASLLARQRYSSGLVDFQTVLDTQRTQLTTQDSVAGARTDLGADHVRLYKALGGGWLPMTARTVPPTENTTGVPVHESSESFHRRRITAEAGSETDLATLLAEPRRTPGIAVRCCGPASRWCCWRPPACGTGSRAGPPVLRRSTSRRPWRAATSR